MIVEMVLSVSVLVAAIDTAPGAAAPVRAPASLSGKTIAVIAGHNKNLTISVADLLTDALNRKGNLQALSSGQIRTKAPVYPANIQGPFQPKYFQTTVDTAKTDVKAVRKIKDQLGVDYLYVVWLVDSRVGMTGIATYRFLTQLFAGPSSAVVYNGELESVTGGSINCLLGFDVADAEKRQRTLVEDSEQHVQQLLLEIERLVARPKPK